MNGHPFVSYAQNREDVVLYRALKGVTQGRYVEVGANDPKHESVTYAFYKRGWSGITVEPVHAFAEAHRRHRERDHLVEAAITASDTGTIVLHQIAETGLSSLRGDVGRTHQDAGWDVTEVQVPARRLDDVLTDAGWTPDQDIHFLLIDVEGAERQVLETIDLRRWRPWALVIEATEPLSTTPSHQAWEDIVLAAGYRFCLFDGLSRFYVSNERADDIGHQLSYGASVLDDYTTIDTVHLHEQLAEAGRRAEEAYHRANGANSGADALQREVARLQAELEELRPQVAALTQERDDLRAQVERSDELRAAADAVAARWRHKAVDAWATSVAGGMSVNSGEVGPLREQVEQLAAELDATHRTLSWRITKPLRAVRSVSLRQAVK